MDKIKKGTGGISDIISWFVGVTGGVSALIAAFKAEGTDFGYAFVCLLVSETIAIILWTLVLYERHRLCEELKIFQLRVKDLEETKDGILQESKKTYDSMQQRQDEILEKMNVIGVHMKNISKLNNDFCTRIPDAAEKSYHFLQVVKNASISDKGQIKEEMDRAYMEFANGLLDLYRRYSKNMLNYLVK